MKYWTLKFDVNGETNYAHVVTTSLDKAIEYVRGKYGDGAEVTYATSDEVEVYE